MSELPFSSQDVALPPVPLEEQLREVRREIALRERVYPRWIEAGKITKRSAAEKVRAMNAVADTLAELIRSAEADLTAAALAVVELAQEEVDAENGAPLRSVPEEAWRRLASAVGKAPPG